jgi:hypothetical protein
MDSKQKAEEMKQAKQGAEDTEAKARELAETAKARLDQIKARLDKDGDGKLDAGMPALTDEQRQAMEAIKAKAKAAQEKLAKKPEDNA